MNKVKTQDNRRVQHFLEGYSSVKEVCKECPRIDDIFSGVLALSTSGDSSTRTLSRKVLFHILTQCHSIDTQAIDLATQRGYADRTLRAYAALARVASRAIHQVRFSTPCTELSEVEQRVAMDAPYFSELQCLGLL